jgi:hypothetical protein
LRLVPPTAAVAFALGAPAAGAAPIEPPVSCGNTIGDQGQAQTGGNDTLVCGAGVIEVAPATSITTTTGPLITGAAGGIVITTTGNVAIAL